MSESEARRWLRFAREDLENAEVELELGRPPRFVCFDAQQAAEKAIKAAVIASGASPARMTWESCSSSSHHLGRGQDRC